MYDPELFVRRTYTSRRWITGDQLFELSAWLKTRGRYMYIEAHGGAYVAVVVASERCVLGEPVPEPKKRKKHARPTSETP